MINTRKDTVGRIVASSGLFKTVSDINFFLLLLALPSTSALPPQKKKPTVIDLPTEQPMDGQTD